MSDKNLVKKIETFKSGFFAFSLNYNREALASQLVNAKVLYTTIAEIPILPKLAATLEEELIKKSIFGTAAIEGNPLSEEKVNEVLSHDDKKGKMERAEQEIRNLKDAYNMIKDSYSSNETLMISEELIQKLNYVITKNCEQGQHIPGQYRNYAVEVGNDEHGGKYKPPKILEDIKTLMKEFIEWINSKEMLEEDAAVRAALAHYYLALIHPFGDGNGRTSRVLEAILLKSAGIKFVPHMLSNFYYKNIDDYFWAFSSSERDKNYDVTPFVEFFLKGLNISLGEIQSRIFSWIRKFTLKDYYLYLKQKKEIYQRQIDLLILLLEFRETFSISDLFEKEKFKVLYRKVSERTARRDIKLLEEKRLIKSGEKGQFSLNYNVLG